MAQGNDNPAGAVLEHTTVHRVVRQTQTQIVFDARDGAGALARLT
jgi:hypothetical protein